MNAKVYLIDQMMNIPEIYRCMTNENQHELYKCQLNLKCEDELKYSLRYPGYSKCFVFSRINS